MNWYYLAIASIIGGLIELVLHYAFHPRLGRRPLGKLMAYVAGTSAWLVPFCIFALVTGGGLYALAALAMAGVAGLAVVTVNLHDELLEARQAAEESQSIARAAERIFSDAQNDG